MKAYNKNFRPEFKILIDYINIKGLQNNAMKDDVFLGKLELNLSYNFSGRNFKTKKDYGHMYSMYNNDIGIELFFDEFFNFYCLERDEESSSEVYSRYELESIDSLDPNLHLAIILKKITDYIKLDEDYRNFKAKEFSAKLDKELENKPITKKVKI